MKKKTIILILLLLAACLALTACSMSSEAEEEIRASLDALSAGEQETFVTYLHPTLAKEDNTEGLRGMIASLGGRSVNEISLTSLHINNGVDASGRYRQESGVCLLLLEDGVQMQLRYIWLSNSEGEGFSSFYIDSNEPAPSTVSPPI